jgi:zinc/manganese transport system substrate-binding protein
MNKVSALAAALVIAAGSTACSSSAGNAPSSKTSSGDTLSLVASTNVYGDIASQIAGDKVKITSIISDPAQDPHSYEASVQTRLALFRADVVIENGGGYDDFVDSMLKTGKKSAVKVLDVVDISGKTAPSGSSLNEHVWYDFPTIAKLVSQLAQVLSAKDPAAASTFTSNARAFTHRLSALEHTEATVDAAHAGAGAAITEPVPLYLLEACGLVNRTPAEFSNAVEAGTDVAPRVLQSTLALFRDKQVSLVAYNEQTSGPETEQVLNAAKANNIAVVPVAETLPAGKTYLSWMSDNLGAVQRALSK